MSTALVSTLPMGAPLPCLSRSIPAVGDLDAYIAAVNRIPLLSAEDELNLARRLRDSADLHAARTLVLAHLRLVVSVARQYLGYGMQHADLIQEGNIGLMKAVKRFDPERGVRLVTFALHWIKAEIHEYILKNWRLVKIATTKAQRKLFFNLRSRKGDHPTLSAEAIQSMAHELDVRTQDVIDMETRMSGGDVSIDPDPEHADDTPGPIAYLQAPSSEPTHILETRQFDRLQSVGLERALAALDERSRRIIESRWLRDDEEGGALTLHDLAREFGVSAERIRQIETKALKAMKQALAEFA